MNLSIITKNYAADPEIGFSQNRFQSRMAAQCLCRQRGSKHNNSFEANYCYLVIPSLIVNKNKMVFIETTRQRRS